MPNPAPPPEKAYIDCMDSAKNSIDAAEYLVARVKKLLSGIKVDGKPGDVVYADLIKVIENFAHQTKHKLTSANQMWLGQAAETTGYKNMQANIVAEAINKLGNLFGGVKDAIQKMVFDYAINQDSQFVRGYSVDGKSLDKETLSEMDKLFNAWLVNNDMANKGGVLYEINPEGEIKRNDEGPPVKANPEEVSALMEEPEKGYIKYLENKGIPAEGHQQEYPGAEPENRASARGGQG